MCEICHQTPCDPRCPNAPEPPVFGECVDCSNEIHIGEMYYEVKGEYYCESCMADCKHEAEMEELF